MLEVPTAIHRGDDELPWVDIGEGSLLKVLQVKEREGLWVIRNRFMPGYDVQTHKHTGPVYAFTTSGAWRYKESDFVNTAGSFLYEPAGSVHTLTVPDDNTEPTDVFFAIWGANLNLDADGNVEAVVDAGLILSAYYLMCEAAGLPEARSGARLMSGRDRARSTVLRGVGEGRLRRPDRLLHRRRGVPQHPGRSGDRQGRDPRHDRRCSRPASSASSSA